MGGVTGLAVMTSGTAVSDTLASVGPWFVSPAVVSSNSIWLWADDAKKVTVFCAHWSGAPALSAVTTSEASTVSSVTPVTVTPIVWEMPVASSPLTADAKDSEYSSPIVVVTSW